MMLQSLIDRLLMENAVPNEAIDLAANLTEKARNLGEVRVVAIRYRRGKNPPLVIYPDMQFLPAFAPFLPALLRVAIPLTADHQFRAVDDKAHRPLRHTVDVVADAHRSISSRHGRVIGAWKVQTHHLNEIVRKSGVMVV